MPRLGLESPKDSQSLWTLAHCRVVKLAAALKLSRLHYKLLIIHFALAAMAAAAAETQLTVFFAPNSDIGPKVLSDILIG